MHGVQEVTTFKRFDTDDGPGTETLAGEIIRIAGELVYEIQESDRKNLMRREQRQKSERSLALKLEKVLAVERLEHNDLAWDVIVGVVHSYESIPLSEVLGVSTDFDICRVRIAAASQAVAAGCAVHDVARVLNRDRALVEHWIKIAGNNGP